MPASAKTTSQSRRQPSLPQHYGVAESIGDYLDECRARGLRTATVRGPYAQVLRRVWLPWCQEQGIDRLEQVTQSVVTRWAVALHDRRKRNGEPLAPHSIRTYAVLVGRWLAWAHREGQVEPARVPSMRVNRPVVEVITDDEYGRMLAATLNDRDRLVLQLLWETGMRASELLRLRTGDLVRHDGRWFLRLLSTYRGGGAKDSRERLVPLPRARDLQRFINGPRARMAGASDHVFLSQRREGGAYRPLTISGLEQVVRRLGQEADIQRSVYPHLFRHSAVTRWLRQGIDPMRIANVVGHASLSMINQHYGHLDHRDAYDALAAVLVKERA